MKKIITAAFLSLFLLMPAQTFAISKTGTATDAASKASTVGKSIGFKFTDAAGAQSLIGTLLSVLFGLLAVIAVLLIVYAGFLWVTAAGSDDQVSKAKDIIKATVIGMIIVGLAYGVVAFVISFTSLQAS